MSIASNDDDSNDDENDDDDDQHDVENSDFKDLKQCFEMVSDFGNDKRVIWQK